jgi:hypothetical protein
MASCKGTDVSTLPIINYNGTGVSGLSVSIDSSFYFIYITGFSRWPVTVGLVFSRWSVIIGTGMS